MIRNPQIGMRIRFTDVSISEYLGKVGTIRDIAYETYSNSYSDEETIVLVQFDGEIGTHDFFCFRLSPTDPDVERREREHLEDQKRRKDHADKYL